MASVNHRGITVLGLEKYLNHKNFVTIPEAPIGCVTRVENSKLNYLILNKLGNDLYLLATVMRKKLETRFMIGGGARNDQFHVTEQLNKHNIALKRFRLIRKRLPSLAVNAKFKLNEAQHFVSTFDFGIFLEIFRATRIPEQPDSVLDQYLRELYDENNDKYHQGTGESTLSDQSFDQLRKYLIGKGLVNSEATGAAPATTSKKVDLKTPLGSLENAFTDSELKAFFKKYPNITSFIQTPKIDGISAQVNYVKGILTGGNTKGDGYVGEDITKLLKLIPSVPKKLLKPETVSIRCELFIKNSVFNKKYGKNSGREKPFANARNMMAGLKNRKDPDPQIAKDVSILGYEILNKLQSKREQLGEIKSLGFPVVPYTIGSLSKSQDIFSKYKNNEDYMQDGSVVEIDDPKHRTGFVGSGFNPKFSVAFKPFTEEAKTTIKSIRWKISKDGFFKPTIFFNPVVVEGATVSKASVHNAKKVKDLGLGPGAEIVIVRAGAAIPHVKSVVKKAKPIWPEGNNWTWNSTGVDIVLNKGESSDQREIEKIIVFFSALNVERFSEGLIKAFYNHGFKTIPDILHMTKQQIIKEVPRQGDTSAQNIISEFEKLKTKGVKLSDLMYASGCFGRGLGKDKFAALYSEYGDKLVSGWSGMRLDDVATSIDEVPGFSFETGKQFALGIKPYLEFYKSIKDVIYVKKQTSIKGKLTGSRISFTGFRNKLWAERIIELGGEYSDNVSTKTTILVNAGGESEKTKKAQKNGTKVISKQEFERLIK